MKKKQQEVPAALDKITDVILAHRPKDQPVRVDIWSHPDWDMKLILEANAASEETARDNLHPDHDPQLLTKRSKTMTRGELDSLPEWDG